MHLTHLVSFAAIEEDSLRHGGLAGIDMGDDAEVSNSAEGLNVCSPFGLRLRSKGNSYQERLDTVEQKGQFDCLQHPRESSRIRCTNHPEFS